MYLINSSVDRPDIGYLYNVSKDLMHRGIRVGDIEYLKEQFKENYLALKDNIKSNYGINNPGSSKQIVEYMKSLNSEEIYEICFNDGKWTTNKDAFSQLAAMGYQFAIDILDYRLVKKYSEYIENFIEACDKNSLIHPEVSLSKTNRINYKNPPLMNIPKPLLWNVIKPYNDGDTLISADIKNQEQTIMVNMLNASKIKWALDDPRGFYEALFCTQFEVKARLNMLVTSSHKEGFISNKELSEMSFVPAEYYSPIPVLTEDTYYTDGDTKRRIKYIDICNIVVGVGGKPQLPKAIKAYFNSKEFVELGVDWEEFDNKKLNKPGIVSIDGKIRGISIECSKMSRAEFKVAWNALAYGVGMMGLKNICKRINPKIVYSNFIGIPEYKKYKDTCNKLAKQGIQEISTYFGTKMTANKYEESELRRALMDLPIQGTASDILSLLVKHFHDMVNVLGIKDDFFILFTRHDEVIVEVSKTYIAENGIEKALAIVKDIFEHTIDNWTSFKLKVEEVVPNVDFIKDEYSEDAIFD